MALTWGERKRLMRLTGLAEEVLTATRMGRDEAGTRAVASEVDVLMGETAALLRESDRLLADEFERVVVRADDLRPPDVRAAALVGWLRAQVHVESLDEAREQMGMTDNGSLKRKLTVGFRAARRRSLSS